MSLIWIPRNPFDQLRAPRHLKDFQRSWFDEMNLEALANREMQGYLIVTSDLWRIAGAHCREYFDKHCSAVLACFNRASMAGREVIFYQPLVELIRIQLGKIHRENTNSIHSSDSGQFSLFSKGLEAVAGRGGGRPPSRSTSFDFGLNSIQIENSAREIAPPAPRRSHGYTQDDFDARDLRKLADAERECERVLEMQPRLSPEDILELACSRIGLPLKRALELKKSQLREAKGTKAFAAAGD